LHVILVGADANICVMTEDHSDGPDERAPEHERE
jgi:hypothetical protein